MRFSRCAFWNTGVSVMRKRTTSPTTTSNAESRNGMRQPHATIASAGKEESSSRFTPYAQKKPMGAPMLGNAPYRARFPFGAFSVATKAAPDHSPPRPKPWQARHTHKRTTEVGPRTSYPGSKPTTKVAIPISIRATTSVFLRPSLSPK